MAIRFVTLQIVTEIGEVGGPAEVTDVRMAAAVCTMRTVAETVEAEGAVGSRYTRRGSTRMAADWIG
jgi:hypothetical protein